MLLSAHCSTSEKWNDRRLSFRASINLLAKTFRCQPPDDAVRSTVAVVCICTNVRSTSSAVHSNIGHPEIQGQDEDAVNLAESTTQRKRDASSHAVGLVLLLSSVQALRWQAADRAGLSRGLDNAGKTTIVKRFMDEDISTVSPTLGFSIKTIEYKGLGSPVMSTVRKSWLNMLTSATTAATNSTYVGGSSNRWTTAALPRRGRPTDSRSIEGDVGGQRTLRSYWRNYYEKTDALVWVVDATDRLRIDDCRIELAGLLLEEVGKQTWQGSSICSRLTAALYPGRRG